VVTEALTSQVQHNKQLDRLGPAARSRPVNCSVSQIWAQHDARA
jgi:hypothetical protein